MISCDGDRCALQGPVTLDNVVAVLEEGARLMPTAQRVVVDLAGVTEVDSAAVSLLLEWRRRAESSNRMISFVNIPKNLKSLATLYGVAELIGAE